MITKATYLILLILPFIGSSQDQSLTDPDEMWAQTKLATMTLEEKIGQLFMIRAHSDKGPDHIKSVEEQIKKYKVGGLCFFQGTPTKQAELTNKYQRLSDTPLMVAIDAEWGLGMRHLGDAVSFPKQLTLGAVSDNTLIYEMGQSIAGHLKRIGVHVNFAPVVDINNNPSNPVIHNRSFGEDIFEVATKSYAYAKGLQDAGVIACMKHFPGHGDTDVDSHYDLPLISHNRGRLDSLEMTPFRVLSELGIKSTMTAHLAIPALDDEKNRPTSLSRKVVTEILQDQLHFDGLIFTDGLEMQGVAKHYKPGIMELEAIKAGNDIMLLPIDIKVAIDKLVSEVNSGRLDESIIDQKALKILRAKYKLHLTGKPYIKNTNRIAHEVNDRAALTIKENLYRKAITLVADETKQVPIRKITKNIASLSLGSKEETTFQKELKKIGLTAHFQAGESVSANEIKNLINKLAPYETIIVSLHDMSIYASKDFGISKSMFDIIYQLQSRKNLILVNNGSPYALKFFPDMTTILQTYEEDDMMQAAAAQALFGIHKIAGKLPVTAHPKFPVKSGICLLYTSPSPRDS